MWLYRLYNFIKLCFWGRKVHVLPDAITWRSRPMTIEVTVIIFRSPSGRGSNQSYGIWMSALCVTWAVWIPSETGFGPNLLGYECVSMACVVGSSHPLEHWVLGWNHMNELRVVHYGLVPYVWAVAGPPGCVCHPTLWWFFGWVMSWFPLN